AALSPADDHGLVGDLGVVALLDSSIKRIAIDMRERQRGQRMVTDKAGRTAGRAAPRLGLAIGKAVPAKAGRRHQSCRRCAHGTSRSQWGSPSTSRAAAMLVGCN